MDKIAKIKELVTLLNRASDAYYNTGSTIMNDAEFDQRLNELKGLEAETGFMLSNSPTQNVGFEVKSKLQKVTHDVILKSLDKTKSVEELDKFIDKRPSVIMLKGDGLTTEIIYDNGELERGSTRGDGTIGENITHNVKKFKNIPLTIKYKGRLVISGESVILNKDFEEINSKLDDDDKYENSRNLVSGSVRQLDSRICASRNVRFYAFSLIEREDGEFDNVYDMFQFLMDQGFEVIPQMIYHGNNVERLETAIDMMKMNAKESGIPIDGLVVTFVDIKYTNSLGQTDHHPLGKLAFKFTDDLHETTYIGTEWATTRTGMISATAMFNGVKINGSTLTRATLHNLDIFESLELGKGDTISIIKANDVIPKIVENETRSNTEEIPKVCPSCGSPTEVRGLVARFLYCTNDNCSASKIKQFEHMVSRGALNIEGLSEATLEKFIEIGIIKEMIDIFRLEQHKEQIVATEGFGEKSYKKLIDAINVAKNTDLARLLYGLGIPQIGQGGSKILAKHFNNSLPDLMLAVKNKFDFSLIPDVGDITSEAITEWFNNTDNINMLNELLEYITIKEGKKTDITGFKSLVGLTFVITGSVHIYANRTALKDKIESLGGTVAGSVSKKTSYLINNDKESTTGKNKSAIDLGIKIISEEEFEELIRA